MIQDRRISSMRTSASSAAPPPTHSSAGATHRNHSWRFSTRTLLTASTIIALLLANAVNLRRLMQAEQQLAVLRDEVGYLGDQPIDQIAAVRLPTDEPLYWKVRVRVPESTRYRLVYSAVWPAKAAEPAWFSALALPAGESVVVVRLAPDPRDGRWKISTLARHRSGSRRMASTLNETLTAVFRGSYEVIRTGIGSQPMTCKPGQSLRLIDDRWLVDDEMRLLYGATAPPQDLPGVYLELQPDGATLREP